jgi:hypothetical protein
MSRHRLHSPSKTLPVFCILICRDRCGSLGGLPSLLPLPRYPRPTNPLRRILSGRNF